MEVVSIDYTEREKRFALPRQLAETHPLATGLEAHPRTRGRDGVKVRQSQLRIRDNLSI